ncbi:MAG: hypothetical protein NTX25_01860 [Proteobacteria bacterium]|nr:hypothetical protein [Pseudomonadota bacterium]
MNLRPYRCRASSFALATKEAKIDKDLRQKDELMQSFTFLILVFCCSFLINCVHSAERLEQSLNSWIGRTPDDLVEAWGAPHSSYTMDKGPKVLSYESSETINRFSSYFRRPDYYSYTESCKINFFTDPSQKTLARVSYLGNSSICLDLVQTSGLRQP